ncbi:MAG: response regulator receiver protein [Frankiales bacterium]|nr:response regulator receiver protein [Frankiales bacterium]
MVVTMSTLLARRAARAPRGREQELRLLRRLTDHEDETLVVHLHGVAGIGKSVLLDAFLEEQAQDGAAVVRLDCRTVEPTGRGFLSEVGRALGTTTSQLDEVVGRLASAGERVVLALDQYEAFRLLDTWLRTTFVPALHDNARMVLVGRDPPVTAWRASPEWRGLFRPVTLGPLDDVAALELLAERGVVGTTAARLGGVAQGHPLALCLAASAAVERPDLDLDEAATQSVVAELTRLFVSDVRDAVTREALDVASVVRRTTLSLLRTTMPDHAPEETFARLQALPFVETGRDGLVLHASVQQAIAATLRSSDPERYRAVRLAAWRQLREEAADVGTPDHWRCTADLLYLIDNPVCREAFFPTGAQTLTVEPAARVHGPVVLALAGALEPEGSARCLREWWDRAPEAFSVVLDKEGAVVGFGLVFEPGDVPRSVLLADPLTAAWWHHLREHPVAKGERVLFLRRWLGEDGEGPSPVQAACWLDVKRAYMAMRPDLRRVYTTVRGLEAFAPVMTRLRFRLLPAAQVDLDGVTYHSALLDFGPGSVDGWLADLAAAELGVQEVLTLDEDAGEVVLDGERVSLTPLEFGVLEHLCARRGKVVSRAAVLLDVWGYDDVSGSNVVDSVVRSLRKKLGPHASAVETVRGFGYRCRL